MPLPPLLAIEAQAPNNKMNVDGGGLTPTAADHRQAGSHLSLLGVATLLPPDQGLGLWSRLLPIPVGFQSRNAFA